MSPLNKAEPDGAEAPGDGKGGAGRGRAGWGAGYVPDVPDA